MIGTARTAFLAAALLGVSACSESPPTTGENVEQAFDNAADYAEDMAENATNEQSEDTLEDSADALKEGGDRLKRAIDRGEVDGRAIENAM